MVFCRKISLNADFKFKEKKCLKYPLMILLIFLMVQ